MSCECPFSDAGKNSLGISCKRHRALKQVSTQIQGVMTPQELMIELCQNPNPEAQTQCPAFVNISEIGASSTWAKK